MDCDDVLLLMARPGHDPRQLAEHLAGCEACRELSAREDEDDDDPPPPVAAASDAAALIGQRVGPYAVTKVIGAGGMGVVYLAVHVDIGSRVAIKVFSRDWSKHPRLVARFFAEARATSVIAHENIVNVLDVGRLDDGRPYLVMEHLVGRPLSAMIGTRELTDDVSRRVILDVLDALAAAHAHGIVHRDLKPDNIFVSPALRTTLLDFGIAKLRPDLTRGATETVSGIVLGTPQYMSPEQARAEPVDARTDLYAIGVILYECLLGRRPFEAPSAYLLLEQHVRRPPLRPRLIRPALGADLEDVVLTALAKDPDDRFASARALHAALAACDVATDQGAFVVDPKAWGAHEEVRERTGTPTVVSGPRARGRRRSRTLVGVVVAASVVAAIVTWQVAARPRSSPAVAIAFPRDAGDAMDAPAVRDAAEAITPAPPDAGVAVEKRPKAKPRARGTAPLALLADAEARARADLPDVTLVRIIVRAPTPDGQIAREAGGSATFDFLSPTLVERNAKRKVASCVVRVIYGAAATPTVERLATPYCATMRPLPAPRCSLATVLKTATARKKLPPGTATMATLMMTVAASHRRPLWKIVVDRIEYNVEYGVVPCS